MLQEKEKKKKKDVKCQDILQTVLKRKVSFIWQVLSPAPAQTTHKTNAKSPLVLRIRQLDNKTHWQPPGSPSQLSSHHSDVTSSLRISRSTKIAFSPAEVSDIC